MALIFEVSRGAADVLVHVVSSRGAADLLVYKASSRGQASGCDELWFETNSRGSASSLISFVSRGSADLLIYYVGELLPKRWTVSGVI